MPFVDIQLEPGVYYSLWAYPRESNARSLLSRHRPLKLMNGPMAYEWRWMSLMTIVSIVQYSNPNILCTAFVDDLTPGDTDGHTSQQGLFFSFTNPPKSDRLRYS